MLKKGLFAVLLVVLAACSKDEFGRGVNGDGSIVFGSSFLDVSQTKSAERLVHRDSIAVVTYVPIDEAESTKVSEVTQSNLQAFSAHIFSSSGYADNFLAEYTRGSGSIFSSAGIYWPSTDRNYRIVASNVPFSGSGDYYVSVDGNTDVIFCSQSLSGGNYHRENDLSFEHVMSRIGCLDVVPGFDDPDGNFMFLGFNSVDITCPVSGTYGYSGSSVTGGSPSWLSIGASSVHSVSDDAFYCVPGTYDITVDFDYIWLHTGEYVGDVVKTVSVTLLEGMKSNIVFNLPEEVDYYDDIVATLEYDKTYCSPHGDVSSPTVHYSQVVHYKSGNTSTITDTGATLTWSENLSSRIGGNVTYNTSNGNVTFSANPDRVNHQVESDLNISMNGKNAQLSCMVYQDWDYINDFDAPVITGLAYDRVLFGADGMSVVTPSTNHTATVVTATYSVTAYYAWGGTTTLTNCGTWTFTIPATAGFSIDSSTGSVTLQNNLTENSRSVTVTGTVSVSSVSGMPSEYWPSVSKTASAQVTITQNGAVIISFDD